MSRTSAVTFFAFVLVLAGNATLVGPLDGAGMAIRLLFGLVGAGALVAVFAARARSQIVTAMIASLLGLFAIEGYEWGFGLFQPPNYPETYDPRTKFEVVLDMRAAGIEAYPTIHPAAYIAPKKIAGVVTMPFGGVANATTVYCKENETGEYLVFESDEQGFNNPPGLWQRDSVAVALVGDSFTQGACALKNSFADVMRRRFDGVLNLGSGNNGPLIELATIKEYLADFRPPHVVWFYYEGNDLFNLRSERRSQLLMGYLSSDTRQGLRGRVATIDEQVRSFVNSSVEQLQASGSRGVVQDEAYGAREFARLELLQKHLRHITLESQPPPEVDMRFLTRILREANKTVGAWGGQLYFVYLPAYELLRRGETEPYREAVLEAARISGFEIIDIDALFRARPDPLDLFPFNQDGVHYTQEGNRLIAEQVTRAIEARKR